MTCNLNENWFYIYFKWLILAISAAEFINKVTSIQLFNEEVNFIFILRPKNMVSGSRFIDDYAVLFTNGYALNWKVYNNLL